MAIFMKVGDKKRTYGIYFEKIDHKEFKYKLLEDYTVQTEFRPAEQINHQYFTLTVEGLLTAKKDYAWDGASGPSIDSDNTMRGSLIHDIFYQMCREKLIKRSYKNRKFADDLFYIILREDGMWWIRAQYYWLAVRGVGWYFVR